MGLQCPSSLRFYDASSLQTQRAENSQLHLHIPKREPARVLRPGGGGGAEPLPVRLRAGIRLALSAGGKAPGGPGWSPARRERGTLRRQLSHRAPQAPAPGSHPRSRRLDWFQRPEAEPQPERRGKWSPKRAPKRSPSIPWACACVPEPSAGDRAVFFPRHRRP